MVSFVWNGGVRGERFYRQTQGGSIEERVERDTNITQFSVTNLFDTTYYVGSLGRCFTAPGLPRFFMGSIRVEC